VEISCQWCGKPGLVKMLHGATEYTWTACAKHADRALDMVRLAQSNSLAPVCLHCGDRMPVPARPQGGGKTKRYCSPRCRTAAHRAGQNRVNAPLTLHEALGTEPATHGPGRRR
jgi:hypothetical protein